MRTVPRCVVGVVWLFSCLVVPLAYCGLAIAQPPAPTARQVEAVRPPVQSRLYARHTFTAEDGRSIDYWLMTPAKIEPGKKYPLVLTLHGRGGNTVAAAVLASEPMRAEYPCYVLAPAVGRNQVWALPGDFAKLRGDSMLPVALAALAKVQQQHPIDAQRIYVTGQSMGGFGTFGALAASPDTFAAAIPICGGWRPDDAAKMKDVAIWIFHGDADRTVPVQRSRVMVEAIKAAGGEPKYSELKGVAHNSWSPAYADPATWKWLFSQRRTKQ